MRTHIHVAVPIEHSNNRRFCEKTCQWMDKQEPTRFCTFFDMTPLIEIEAGILRATKCVNYANKFGCKIHMEKLRVVPNERPA